MEPLLPRVQRAENTKHPGGKTMPRKVVATQDVSARSVVKELGLEHNLGQITASER